MGADTFVVSTVTDVAPGETINGTLEAATIDTIRLDVAGTYNPTGVTITNIDAISFNQNAAGFNLTVTDSVVSTADANGDGILNDIQISAAIAMTNGVTIDASGLTGTNHITTVGTNLGGNDTIIGGAGADTIAAGAGADTSTGGAGADTFVFKTLTFSLASSFDTITDFTSGTDLFQIGHTMAGLNTGLTNNAGTGNLANDLLAVLTSGNLVANGAAEVTINGGSAAGTYAIINDGTAGFNSAADAVIKLQNAQLLHTSDFIV